MSSHSLIPDITPIPRVDQHTADQHPAGTVVATDDHELIRAWARHNSAEPATGEATESGPATVDVHDGGAGIRFNFPAAGRFRSISWDEWFRNFHEYDLLFVYERDAPGANPNGRYQLTPQSRLRDRVLKE